MLARIIFGLITLISIAWIAVASHMQHQQTTQFKIDELFGPKDHELIIVNHFAQLDLILETEPGKLNWAIFSENAPDLMERIYYSKTQNHALIQTHEIVTEDILNTLFQTPVSIQKNTFSTEKYTGHFNHTNIYISEQGIQKNEVTWLIPALDRNAISNTLQFHSNVIEVRDFYSRTAGQQLFSTIAVQSNKLTSINDSDLFAHILSNQIGDYQFYSKSNANSFEENCSKQNWMDLMESGFVATSINNQIGIYIDARPNTDIYQLSKNQVNDGAQIMSFETTVESPFFNNRKILFIGNLDDHYVISPSRTFCEDAIAHYKLGQVLQTNPSKMNRIYGGLPRKVNQRVITKEQQYATRFSSSQKLSFAKLGSSTKSADPSVQETNTSSTEPTHFNIGSDIKWAQLDRSGRIAVLDDARYIHYFGLNGKILSQQLPLEQVPTISFVQRPSGEQLLSVRTAKNVKLYSPTGALAFQGDTPGNQNFTSDASSIRVKNRDYWIIGASDGVIYWFNAENGKVEKQSRIASGRELTRVSTWISANKPIIGAWTSNQFFIVQAETNKQFRTFVLNGLINGALRNNDYRQVVLDKGQVKIVNQKGQSQTISVATGSTEVRAINNSPSHFVAFNGKDKFVIFNISGEVLLTRTIANTTIDQFDCTMGQNQAFIVAFLDDVNNTIQVLNLSTEQKVGNGEYRGGGKVLVHPNGKSVFLYTLIDNILIRYDQ